MFTAGQYVDAILFMIGVGILTWCANLEHKQMAKMRDPRERWAYIDGGKDQERELRNRAVRSWILTVFGAVLSMYAFIDFLAQI